MDWQKFFQEIMLGVLYFIIYIKVFSWFITDEKTKKRNN